MSAPTTEKKWTAAELRKLSAEQREAILEAAAADRFRTLAEQWKRETIYLSNITKKAMHPAYQRIIGLGEVAVPLILDELKKDPADWFWALTAITGENPIPAASAGNIEQMAEAWLKWGREHGY